jgi:hypothetical protein
VCSLPARISREYYVPANSNQVNLKAPARGGYRPLWCNLDAGCWATQGLHPSPVNPAYGGVLRCATAAAR